MSKMMINEEIHASWDQPTSSIVMHRADLSRLQTLSLQFSDKVRLWFGFSVRILLRACAL